MLYPAEEMKEHRGISCDLLSCPDVRMKRRITQSLVALSTSGHRCADRAIVAGVISSCGFNPAGSHATPRASCFGLFELQ